MQPSIIIVGGGFAGIIAAQLLCCFHTMDVVVYDTPEMRAINYRR
jgi:predicted NAD/FAD-dependent oxidoreductase